MRYDAIRRLRPKAEFQLTQYVDPDGLPAPSREEVAATAAALDAEATAAQAAAAQVRQQVRAVASGAVGKRFDTVTAGEVRALLAVLLWRAGALGSDGTVQPLDEWVR